VVTWENSGGTLKLLKLNFILILFSAEIKHAAKKERGQTAPIILMINVKKLPFHNNFYENRTHNNRI